MSMQLVDACPIRNGDMVFTTEETKQFDTNFLRNLAANANTDAVNGRSTRLEIISYYGRQMTLGDYLKD